jgi:hypothetical protein
MAVSSTPSDTFPKTILLRGNDVSYNERRANAVLRPGELLDINDANEYVRHASAAGAAVAEFAMENFLMGRGIDTDYAAGDTVVAAHGKPGDWFYAWLEEEANVQEGDLLESNGAGALQAVSGNFPICRALEAKDVTTISGPVRIKVEVI